jgi:hypothetical protein
MLHASFRLKPEDTMAVDKKPEATTDKFTGSFISAEK